jgi:hypothetical protein
MAMTRIQQQAFWEICRQGFPLMADDAASRWESGGIYELDNGFRLPRVTQDLIDLCNWENRRRARRWPLTAPH